LIVNIEGIDMTRINILNPAELTDQHLLAECRELPRMFTYIEQHGDPKRSIPPAYTLGAGHMLFMTNKAEYLFGRMLDLLAEHYDRGYRFDFDLDGWEKRFDNLPAWCKNDYTVTEEALAINRQRIAERIASKPHYYRMRGQPL